MTLADLLASVGQPLEASRWIEVDQARINAFARLTEDEQYIHVDPVQARDTPFGGTIAHGFLTLSLASAMAMDALPPVTGSVMGINYGFDSLRFLSPVPSGAKIRGHFRLLSLEDRGDNRWLFKHELSVEIQGQTKPALVGEWLSLQVIETAN